MDTITITGLPALCILTLAIWGAVSFVRDVIGYVIERNSHQAAPWRH